MSDQRKWVSFGLISLTVILFILLFHNLANKNKCGEPNHLRFRETGQCFEKGERGPCSPGMLFVEDDHKSLFGACSCPYMLTNRTVLHHNGECYYIFTQAYCSEGYWLNVTAEGPDKGKPFCEINLCLQHSANGLEAEISSNIEANLKIKDQIIEYPYEKNATEWVPIKGGRCAKLKSRMEGCPEGSVVRFHKNYILPSCFEPLRTEKKFGQSLAAIGVGAFLTCPSGSAKAITGICQPTFDFDFEEPTNKS